MRELRAKATKAKKDTAIDAAAMPVNSPTPQFDTQSSTMVAADDDADIRRYARVYLPVESTNHFHYILSFNKDENFNL